uniref:Dermonecrotic toxin LiSicTox-alphaII2 n=1 Tax=Loxosceles intermedia TaxID=58218 RepID=A22_LOXIN|nr:RecName: Full=Dermonecrotic toxin LiSicTox-alphaII2; AltName: Full=Loxtox i5; AltName: Full=Phospholipase D; Short=PLD; AltName: Full=Sphingomyelin phosphodiesterase D; Short=SMD; Short=SMase D; Short=Sphingomyelinase D; Flags: Precursor [Loxosceles intermedia]ABU43333.1 loxtox i5 [Loxosceles intermedia]
MLLRIALILGCWSILSEGAENDIAEREDRKRPIWNMAHMVNAISQIHEFGALGANSIETDVSFDKNAKPEYTFHGIPCDCFRNCMNWEYFNHFLEGLRNATTPGNPKYRDRMILVVFDLKSNGLYYDAQARDAGKNLALSLLQNYWNNGDNGGRAYIVLSVPLLKHYELFQGFRETLKEQGHEELLEKVGYDFSGNDDISDIEEAYRLAGISEHIWQSDGITNCIYRGFDRVIQAVNAREKFEGIIKKVYFWTADKPSTVKLALGESVDGIMTNYPNVVVDVLKIDEYQQRFRFATIDDNPWEKYKPYGK